MISSGGGGALESFNYLVDIPWGSRSLVLVYGGEDCGEGGGTCSRPSEEAVVNLNDVSVDIFICLFAWGTYNEDYYEIE